MGRRRRGDRGGVHERGELLQRRDCLRAVERGDGLRVAEVRVVDGREPDRSTRRGGEFGVNARVQLADVADPDDADVGGVHASEHVGGTRGMQPGKQARLTRDAAAWPMALVTLGKFLVVSVRMP